MPHSATIESDLTANGPMVAPVPQNADAALDRQLRDGWPSIGLGIILAGGAYPVALAAIVILVGAISWFFAAVSANAGLAEVGGAFFMALLTTMTAFLASVVGFVWTNLVTVLTLPWVYLVVRSLKVSGSIIWLGAFCGGLIGFIAVMPFLFELELVDDLNELVRAAMILALGPGLTTILGQIGGAWGGRRAIRSVRWYDRAVASATASRTSTPSESIAPMHDREARGPSARLQFSLRHLMWAAVWISLLMSLIRLSGVPFEFVLPLLLGWLVYQAATLWVGGWLVRRLGSWWNARRARRST